MGKYSVSLKKVVDDNSLGVLYAPKPVEDVYVTSYDVNRPGLMLAGYSAYFDAERLQFLGLTEMNYVSSLDEETAAASMERLMATQPSPSLSRARSSAPISCSNMRRSIPCRF